MRIDKNYKYQGQPVGPELVGKHIVWVVWGESPDLDEQEPSPYIFNTQAELDAFLRGATEAFGCDDCTYAGTEELVIEEVESNQ